MFPVATLPCLFEVFHCGHFGTSILPNIMASPVINPIHSILSNSSTEVDSDVSERWVTFVMICVGFLVIGNLVCLSLTGKIPSLCCRRSSRYSKIKIISSSDEDLTTAEELDIDIDVI